VNFNVGVLAGIDMPFHS